MSEPLFSKRGGYRKLDTFMLATLIYYATVAFCRKHITSSRQQEQMTQAGRSGRQNIAEGSERSSTSTETEIKLTDVARASLVELMLDYEDFINLGGHHPWRDDAPESVAIRSLHLKRLDATEHVAHEFSKVAAENRALFAPWLESDDPLVVANALVRLCNRADWLLRKQLDALGERFLDQGGMREKMTRVRLEARDAETPKCPKCGKPMRLRTVKKGPTTGEQFWGCTGFTAGCHSTLPLNKKGDSNRIENNLSSRIESNRQDSIRIDNV